jgi:phosphate transport system protein
MSPADSADANGAGADGSPPEPSSAPARLKYAEELEQLRLQTEVMGVLVDQNLERMREVLTSGDVGVASTAVAADDEIDAMNVSLTEQCYQLLARQAPMAGDLRLVVSVVRVTGELERIGDLSLRVAKLAPEFELLRADDRAYDILLVMADSALEEFRLALRAWGTQDLSLAEQLASAPRAVDLLNEQLSEAIVLLEGPLAVPVAVKVLIAGQAMARITDHSQIFGSRMRYLFTGDPRHLAAEVR